MSAVVSITRVEYKGYKENKKTQLIEETVLSLVKDTEFAVGCVETMYNSLMGYMDLDDLCEIATDVNNDDVSNLLDKEKAISNDNVEYRVSVCY